jgi:hypothetical protein
MAGDLHALHNPPAVETLAWNGHLVEV